MQQLLIIALLVLSSAVFQPNAPHKPPLPVVKAAETPIYPALARAARIEGTVLLKVKTDGQVVVTVEAKDGHKMLREAAEQNVRTWRFYPHTPTSFEVSFVYRIGKLEVEGWSNSTVVMEFPTKVEVTTNAPQVETQISY
jgi:TonB family protein